MNDYLLTIAVPTYNGAKTIRDMLEFLLPQVDERVEVLVLDNCSTDETPDIVSEYQKRYPFINSIRNQENIGPDRNFLNAYQKSKGKFVLLLSDDDVLIENKLKSILDFLEANPQLALVYLETAGFYVKYQGLKSCTDYHTPIKESFVTTDKKTFIKYAQHYWGFISSFICAREKINESGDLEAYFGSYWLQSYIHILCSREKDALLGVLKGPCIAAGIYVNLNNFDTAAVNGVYYRKMLDFAVEQAGYDAKQMDQLFIRRLCMLEKRDVIKERASGLRKTSIRKLIAVSWKYPRAYIDLYPYFLLPPCLCRFIYSTYRKIRGADGEFRYNRLDSQ